MKKLLLLFLTFTVHWPLITDHCLWAVGPNTISYQGRLRESGQPVSGTRSIQFKVFDAASAGTPVFDSDPQTIYISSGIFGYQLGSNIAAGYQNFKDLSWATSNYWLEISVGGNAMSPREQINAVPYSFMASTATSLNGSGNIQITGAGPHYITNGNVGIGTTSPVQKLDVRGQSYFQVSVSTAIGYNGLVTGYNAYSLGSSVGDYSSNIFYLDSNAANRIGLHSYLIRYITPGDWSTAKLRLSQCADGFMYSIDHDYNNLNWIDFIGNGFGMQMGSRNTVALATTSSGRVGVGMIYPNASLHVSSTTSSNLLVVSSGVQAGQEIMTVTKIGRVGIGTTNPGAKLNINDADMNGVRILLSGQEFYDIGNSADGIAFLVGVNRTENRQLWIGDSANLARNSTNSVIRIAPGSSVIDSIATDGTTGKQLRLGNAAGVYINGPLSKQSGSFDIPHPDPGMEKQGYRLRHYFVESPTAGDNIYRYVVEVKGGKLVMPLPGYFKFLNKDAQVWVSPKGHFGRAYGEINDTGTELSIYADTDGKYNLLVVGTRKDKAAQTDYNNFGIEYIKQ